MSNQQLNRNRLATSSYFRRCRGFTLIELLVVIGIIGVLVTMLLPSLTGARANAAALQSLANLRGVTQATQFYAGDNKSYGPPGATNNEVTTIAYKCGAGRGIYGYAGAYSAGLPYGPKGLGVLVRDYNVPLRSLFTQNFEQPGQGVADDYALATYCFQNSPSSYVFFWPLSSAFWTTGFTIGDNSQNTLGLVSRYQSQIECDYVYRAGDYSTFDTTATLTTGTTTFTKWDVSSNNLRTDNAFYNKKTLIMSGRSWYQGRPSIRFARGVGYDCSFGDGSAVYYKLKDGTPKSVSTDSIYLNVDTATVAPGVFVPATYSGYTNLQASWVAFALADKNFAR